jgi:N-acetyl-gamma-glutamyl-phosphate reductase
MIKVGIVGGTGYSGAELLRLIARHPAFKLAVITSRGEAGMAVADLWPSLRGAVTLKFEPPDPERLAQCELVFFATPNGTAMAMAAELLAAGVKIIDLAADFRFRSAQVWERWYGVPHVCPDLLAEAVYGLPELNAAAISRARLVANPGCYPTATILGLLPLIEAGVIETEGLIADAKSGVSGAGRKLANAYLYSEASENFHAYGVDGHRHAPEILQVLEQAGGRPIGLDFVPHLTPMVRGIHATLYAMLADTTIDVQALYQERYRPHPFVDVMPADAHPQTRSVRGSNFCRIAAHRPGGGRRLVILSVIDNLTKGAAGQAIQNANLMFGLEQVAGLGMTGEAP